MTYSFFGTCANDFELLIGCIETMKNQTLQPNSISIVDSGSFSRLEELNKILEGTSIKLIYQFINTSRIKALNLALEKTDSDYLLRFDTRTRFGTSYAEKCISILKSNKYKYIGGVPCILPFDDSKESKICAELFSRPYLFLNSKHRIKNYTGKTETLYLGAFNSAALKSIKYRENVDLISEDSLLSFDFITNGIYPRVFKNLKLSYICRNSINNLIKLFNSYGYCRANTFILSGNFHRLNKINFSCFLIFTICYLYFFSIFHLLTFYLVMVLLYNLFNEAKFFKNNFKIIYPLISLLLQISWGIGLAWGFITSFQKKNKISNFIN